MRSLFTRAALVLALPVIALLSAGPTARAEDAPFPAGTSSHELHGLKCSIVMPGEFDAAAEHSLVVILHGYGGTETGMAAALAHLAADDYVVCAPKSRGDGWEKRDLGDVRAIVIDLKQSLNVGERRLHAVGFSNGGWNLHAVAFDDKLRFQSATWVAAGHRDGRLPKHAKEMGILALAGAEDGNRSAAEATPDAVRDDVRMTEVRLEPGLGHKWPRTLMPYMQWWLGVQEDRFVPGESMAFEWTESRDAALAAIAAGTDKARGVAYWYDPADADDERARVVQNDVLQDRRVRFFGEQLTAWRMNAAEHPGLRAELKIKSTPAFVTYDRKGRVKKVVQGKVTAKSLGSALRSVAPAKRLPE